MGINIHVYSYWGVRTEWNEEFNNDSEFVYARNIEKYGQKGHPADSDCHVVSDGMSCEYMVFGRELYDSGDSRWGDMVNANQVEITQEILDSWKAEYLQKFKLVYPQHYEWFAKFPWKLVNFVHYS